MARAMKDSGIDWIGEIPEDWKTCKLKNIASSFSYNISLDELIDDNTCYQVFGASGLAGYSKNKRMDNEYLGIVKDGAGIGRVNLYPKNSSLLGTMAYILPKKDTDIIWLKYLINSLELNRTLEKTTIPHIYFSDYGNKTIPSPNLFTQKKIADFLDKKCQQIDSVLEKTKESIEEYKKLKNAVITQAVTKGIRPNRKMKDSGNLWLNEVPADWEIKKIKYIFRIKKDIAGKEGYTVLSITQKGIKPKDLSKNEGQIAENYSNYQFVNIGDFAMNHMDLLTGWVDISKYEGVTSPDYRVFIFQKPEENSKEYYLYFMQMCYTNRIFYGLGQGVSGMGRWRLQADKFLNFTVTVPSLTEQKEISDYLDKKCSQIDNLISKKEQLITELETYKKSLIYEYVTGKKEVI